MTSSIFLIPLTLFLLLSTKIEASRYKSILQTRADECPNPISNACLFADCANDGICQEDRTTAYCYKCICKPGFTGRICDTSISISPSGCNPSCKNGGICNGNVCVCPPGFKGASCETRDYCLPINPCQNGGRCISTSTNYVCDCSNTGYTGVTCSEALPTDPCASNPCQNGGQCSMNGNTMNCVCINGYTGTLCQFPPIPCSITPCENGGKCELLAGNIYGCVCPPEFTGSRCENSILGSHPCITMAEIVCQNGGLCTINGVDYHCKCATGWSGKNCQTQEIINTCNPSPCGLYGKCLEAVVGSVTFAYCNCDNRWTGKYCDVNMDTICPNGYCLSGGVCRINGNVPYCECPSMFTGQRCETYLGTVTTTTTTTTTTTPGITSCPFNPCQNGGLCYNTGVSLNCVCTELYTGQRCETYLGTVTTTTSTTTTTTPGITSCPFNPCQNGGLCYYNGMSLNCVCSALYTGKLCETFIGTVTTTTTATSGITPCSLNPCQNGGTCYNNGNNFYCACSSLYTGRQCETFVGDLTTIPSISPCSLKPCQNGGTCYNNGASYYCACPANNLFTGRNCETIISVPSQTCTLNCSPGECVPTGSSLKPYACLCNGIVKPNTCV